MLFVCCIVYCLRPRVTPFLGDIDNVSTQGDRFIAHRPSINFDLCNHMLVRGDNAENEPQAGSDAPPPLHREFHQAMKNTLLSPMMAMRGTDFMCKATNGGARGKTMPPRLLSFSERPPPQEERFTNVLKVLLFYRGRRGSHCCLFPKGGVRLRVALRGRLSAVGNSM